VPTATDPATSDLLDCLDATYLADVTIPDNTHLEKEENFVKIWSVRNNGTCDWPADTQLVFVSGNQMGAPSSVTIGTVEAGESAEVSIEMISPNADANFQSKWQFATGSGDIFGTWLSVVIRVGAAPTAVPAPPPAAPPPSGGGGTMSRRCNTRG
jgi:hypothetical protein